MRKLLFVLSISLIPVLANAQNVAINADGSNPDASAMLDIKSNNKGLLIPRLTANEKETLVLPATGLLIYQVDGENGFYYNEGSPALPRWLNILNAGTGWSTQGNYNGGILGTLSDQPLYFKVNNVFSGVISRTNENTSFGYNTGNDVGNYNVAIGSNIMYTTMEVYSNTAVGASVLPNSWGSVNTALGHRSMHLNTLGGVNVAVGAESLFNNSTGNNNVAIGYRSLEANTSGNNNTTVGNSSNVGAANLTNASAFGANSFVECTDCLVLGSVAGKNSATVNSRVGIGTTNPDISAAIEINSSDKGILIPRLTLAQRNGIPSPAIGLMVFQNDNTPGLYFYNGAGWSPVTPNLNTLWSVNGNTGTNASSNFIGTTDHQPIIFKANNQIVGRLDGENSASNLSFGVLANQNNGGGYNVALGTATLINNNSGEQNVAVGSASLFSNTIGGQNTGTGYQALMSNTTGNLNSGNGNYSLGSNTTGNNNTGSGSFSLIGNSSGSFNTGLGFYSAVGSGSLTNATAIGAHASVNQDHSIVLGSIAGVNYGSADVNVGIGTTTPNYSSVLELNSNSRGFLMPRMNQAQRNSIVSPTVGLQIYQTDNQPGFYYYDGIAWVSVKSNTNNLWALNGNSGTNSQLNYIGTNDNQPLVLRTNGSLTGRFEAGNDANLSLGYNAGLQNTGTNNIAIGSRALILNASGFKNVAVGSTALFANTSGRSNTAIGTGSLHDNTGGTGNSVLGSDALTRNTEGNGNTASGSFSLTMNTTGHQNSVLGSNALNNNISGTGNTALGFFSDVSSADLTNSTAIGYGAIVDASNKVRIGNSSVTVIEGQVPFTTPSDGRYKYNVEENVKGLDFILKLRPLTYQFDAKKLDDDMNPNGFRHSSHLVSSSYHEASSIRRTGFIAQEVEKAAKEVGYNFSGVNIPKTSKDHYGLSYESFVVPLVKAVQEQQAEIELLKRENEELKKLKEQVEILTKAVEKLSGNK